MIVDSHCHLHDAAFADVRETLRTALAHDVWGQRQERHLGAAHSLAPVSAAGGGHAHGVNI